MALAGDDPGASVVDVLVDAHQGNELLLNEREWIVLQNVRQRTRVPCLSFPEVDLVLLENDRALCAAKRLRFTVSF